MKESELANYDNAPANWRSVAAVIEATEHDANDDDK